MPSSTEPVVSCRAACPKPVGAPVVEALLSALSERFIRAYRPDTGVPAFETSPVVVLVVASVPTAADGMPRKVPDLLAVPPLFGAHRLPAVLVAGEVVRLPTKDADKPVLACIALASPTILFLIMVIRPSLLGKEAGVSDTASLDGDAEACSLPFGIESLAVLVVAGTAS